MYTIKRLPRFASTPATSFLWLLFLKRGSGSEIIFCLVLCNL